MMNVVVSVYDMTIVATTFRSWHTVPERGNSPSPGEGVPVGRGRGVCNGLMAIATSNHKEF